MSVLCPADAIPDIQNMPVERSEVSERAYYIWKRYGNPDAAANYYLAEKEIRMEARLREVFRLLDVTDQGECSFKQLLVFGDFIGVEWTLLYLREAFNVFDATEDSIINLSQFLRFTVNELNGLDIQLFNYMVEGFIIYTGFDYRMREELQNCFTSMPSYKLCTVSISDFLYLAEYLSPEKDRSYHLRVLSAIDVVLLLELYV